MSAGVDAAVKFVVSNPYGFQVLLAANSSTDDEWRKLAQRWRNSMAEPDRRTDRGRGNVAGPSACAGLRGGRDGRVDDERVAEPPRIHPSMPTN